MKLTFFLLLLIIVYITSLSLFNKNELTKEYREKFEIFLKNFKHKREIEKLNKNNKFNELNNFNYNDNNNDNLELNYTIKFKNPDKKILNLAKDSVNAILVFDSNLISKTYCNDTKTRYNNFHWEFNWENGEITRGPDGNPINVGQDVTGYDQLVGTIGFFKQLVSHGGKQCVCGDQSIYASDNSVGTREFSTFSGKDEHTRKSSWRGFMCGTFLPGVLGPDPFTACEEAYYDYHTNPDQTCINLGSAFDLQFNFPKNESIRLYEIQDYNTYCNELCKVIKNKYEIINLTPFSELLSRVKINEDRKFKNSLKVV
jgi:hypothetical protein